MSRRRSGRGCCMIAHAYARALGSRANGAMLRNDPSAGELLDAQMRHIWRLGLLASDVAVAAMLNAASTATSPEVCTRYVDECDRLIPQVTYYSDDLRLARVLLSNYFRLVPWEGRRSPTTRSGPPRGGPSQTNWQTAALPRPPPRSARASSRH